MPSADISEVVYTGDTVSTKEHLPAENRPFVILDSFNHAGLSAMQNYEDSFQKETSKLT